MVKAEKERRSPWAKLYREPSPKRGKEEDKHSHSVAVDEKNARCSSISSDGNDRELQAVFDCMDANRDGKISPAELQSSVEMLGGAMSEEEAEAAVRLLDLNEDGFLDFDEFRKLMEGRLFGEEEKTRELKETFRMYTAEGSENITPASLRKMLIRLGESRSIEDCKAMIRAFDLNADGVLSFDEFAIMMR